MNSRCWPHWCLWMASASLSWAAAPPSWARALLARHPSSQVTGLEVDERQHAKNLAAPQPGLSFVAAGAQAIPAPDAGFDLALMLKSLHHVPRPLMAQALAEVARVLRPGGWLYVSEPVYAGPFNDVIRHFNDEGVVRAAAQGSRGCVLAGRYLDAGGRTAFRGAPAICEL